jgi:hypothetical protein
VVLDGYVRVSQVRGRAGERFISPAVPRDQIEGWVRLRGARLGEVFEELDESGRGRTGRCSSGRLRASRRTLPRRAHQRMGRGVP